MTMCRYSFAAGGGGGGGQAPAAPTHDGTEAVALVDEFMTGSNETGEIGDLGWTLGAGSVTFVEGTADHPGVVRRATGAVANQMAYMQPHISFNIPTITVGNVDEMWWTVALEDDAGNYKTRFGLAANSAGDPPTDGIYLERLSGEDAWFGVCRAGGVETPIAGAGRVVDRLRHVPGRGVDGVGRLPSRVGRERGHRGHQRPGRHRGSDPVLPDRAGRGRYPFDPHRPVRSGDLGPAGPVVGNRYAFGGSTECHPVDRCEPLADRVTRLERSPRPPRRCEVPLWPITVAAGSLAAMAFASLGLLVAVVGYGLGAAG